MAKELATVRLFRFDPKTDKKPEFRVYHVPYKGWTVLDVLRYIYGNFDDTFAFRWACTKGFCRSCVVLLNGKPILSCVKNAEENMRIEPHPKFKILKDLIVDFDNPKA